MCDYCGCRTRSLVAALGEDHDRIRSLSARAQEALDAADEEAARAALAELAAVLAPHSALEEGGLYPAVGDVGVEVERMYADHAEVDAAIARAAHGDDALSAVPGALRRLADHIHLEEFDLFPAAHQLLDDVVWDRLEQHHHDVQHERGVPHRHEPDR